MALFIVGFLAIVAIFAVHIFGDTPPGLALYLVALACPIGFLLAIVYTLRSGRRVR
jgi:TRAP-type C4-dicarboxylate transport system permease small subunit